MLYRRPNVVLPSFDLFFLNGHSGLLAMLYRRPNVVRPGFLNGLTALPRFSAMVWEFLMYAMRESVCTCAMRESVCVL